MTVSSNSSGVPTRAELTVRSGPWESPALMPAALRLLGTPASHFTRKIRILLTELEVEFEFVRTSSFFAMETSAYGGHPLLRVPVLEIDGASLVESDHIARYVVSKFDPADRLGVLSTNPNDLNALAVANGIMANSVVLIMAKRGGVEDVQGVAYFRKLTAAMEQGLEWLEERAGTHPPAFRYPDVALVCMWQHLSHFQLLPGLDRYPGVADRVNQLATRLSVASTTPQMSLAEAVAAGWKAS
jgi:glutathione S-transferase